ncbi:unnamed protein product [Eruca vesicaria subsp. sativa]|uniref:Transmembrane protein n=1 Tax=Eruca vesicaria subsp. sativa TaxID=29727 RepID=A0ABC8L2Z0_ERUVS|nr:unnamed protein product [Eruca vesicaria subsp. sativa]
MAKDDKVKDNNRVASTSIALSDSFLICKAAISFPDFFKLSVIIHLALTLLLRKLFPIDTKLLLLTSNANIGGPTTACAMATAKGWIFGVSIATFLGIGCGVLVLKRLYSPSVYFGSKPNLKKFLFEEDGSE